MIRHRKLTAVVAASAAAVAGVLFLAQDKSTLRIQSPLAVDDARFPAYLAGQLNAPITRGNTYTVLQNGDEFFPPMVEAIKTARQRIEFESYILSGAQGETSPRLSPRPRSVGCRCGWCSTRSASRFRRGA